jgi:hypothetical protein
VDEMRAGVMQAPAQPRDAAFDGTDRPTHSWRSSKDCDYAKHAAQVDGTAEADPPRLRTTPDFA